MTNYNIKVDLHDLPKTFSDATVDAAKRRALEAATLQLENDVKDSMSDHVRTGRSRASISRLVTSDRGVVGGNTPALPILEAGSKPHLITPRTRKVLAWPASGRSAAGLGRGPQGTLKGKGSLRFARSVRHPGTKAYRFFGNALEKGLPSIVATFERFLREALS